jgi:hypothetical protein
MPDQEIIDLLAQIRDLQKQHAENYQQAPGESAPRAHDAEAGYDHCPSSGHRSYRGTHSYLHRRALIVFHYPSDAWFP